jgi:hypothetical protein
MDEIEVKLTHTQVNRENHWAHKIDMLRRTVTHKEEVMQNARTGQAA